MCVKRSPISRVNVISSVFPLYGSIGWAMTIDSCVSLSIIRVTQHFSPTYPGESISEVIVRSDMPYASSHKQNPKFLECIIAASRQRRQEGVWRSVNCLICGNWHKRGTSTPIKVKESKDATITRLEIRIGVGSK